MNEINLLKVGRHFRLTPTGRVIIGRNEEENKKMSSLAREGDICFWPQDVAGPLGIGRGNFDQSAIALAAEIMARYSDNFPKKEKTTIAIGDFSQNPTNFLIASGIQDERLELFRI